MAFRAFLMTVSALLFGVSSLLAQNAEEIDTGGLASPAVQVFEDWTVRCRASGDAQHIETTNLCQMTQSAAAAEGMEDVFLLSVAPNEGGQGTTAVVTVPLGVYLGHGIHIFVDGRQAFVLPFEVCDQRACYAGFEMSSQLVSSWRRGAEARFRVWTGRERAVEFPVSLLGFTAAWAAFQEAVR